MDDTITFTVTCVICNKVVAMRLGHKKLLRWCNGELCQNVFPELTPAERDVLITHICEECQ